MKSDRYEHALEAAFYNLFLNFLMRKNVSVPFSGFDAANVLRNVSFGLIDNEGEKIAIMDNFL